MYLFKKSKNLLATLLRLTQAEGGVLVTINTNYLINKNCAVDWGSSHSWLIAIKLTEDTLTEHSVAVAMKLSWQGQERYPKPISPQMLLNDMRIIFSFELWLWGHPSHCVKSLPGSAR